MKSNIEKVEVSCHLCGSGDRVVLASGSDHEYSTTTDDRFFVVKCMKCGLVYLNPRPAESELATIYPREYAGYIDDEGVAGNSLLSRLKTAFVNELGYPKRVRTAVGYLPRNGSPLRLLDVGCGTGRVLSLFREYYPGEVETVGVDFDSSAVEIARKKGHGAICGMFEAMDFPPCSFDCVYSSHVIEHVADPGLLLSKVVSVLAPGGFFFCETPNIGSIDARLLSRLGIWGGFHFPRHWTFFSPGTLRKLAENAGLEFVGVRFYLIPILWIWSLHLLGTKLGARQLTDALFPPHEHQCSSLQWFALTGGFTAVDFLLRLLTGQTACMFMILRKPGN